MFFFSFFNKKGPTNTYRSSSPCSNLPDSQFNETANANLLNPKSPTNSLMNRTRLPNRNNNINNPLVSHNSSQLPRSLTSSNFTDLNSNNNNRNPSLLNKNTSPPVISSQKPMKSAHSMHHSQSLSSLPVKNGTKKNDNFNDIFKVFKVIFHFTSPL